MGLLCQQEAIFPATLQMTELWVYSIFHAARLNILVYFSSYFWHGFHTEEVRSLPSSHLPRDSKIYLALNLRFSSVHRNLYPYPCTPSQSTHGVLGLQRTLEFMSTFWSLFSKVFLVKYHFGKRVCQDVISGKHQILSTPHNNKQPAKPFSGTSRTAIWKGGQEVKRNHLVF